MVFHVRGAACMVFMVVATSLTTFAQSSSSLAEATLRRQAEAIKPAEADLRWQQLPWELDLDDAIRLARQERRPIFFWAAGGRDRDGIALERC